MISLEDRKENRRRYLKVCEIQRRLSSEFQMSFLYVWLLSTRLKKMSYLKYKLYISEMKYMKMFDDLISSILLGYRYAMLQV